MRIVLSAFRQFMICFLCSCEEFNVKTDAVVVQEYKGITLEVPSPTMVCKKCGWETLGRGQVDALLSATKKCYVEKIAESNQT